MTVFVITPDSRVRAGLWNYVLSDLKRALEQDELVVAADDKRA